METLNLTPTWSGLYPAFEAIIMTGSVEAKRQVCRELKELFKNVDINNEEARNEK